MKINGSITDFPIYTSLETYFKEFKNAGVDGVEVVGGYKNRWSFKKLFALSKEYNLPITSFHQPIWSGVGAYFDEGFFHAIADHNVRYVTLHPLAFRSFKDKEMKKYFEKMAKVQETYKIHMLLENMPNDFAYAKLFDTEGRSIKKHLEAIYEIGEEYGFLLTFDISHAEMPDPSSEKIFSRMLPAIAVIHLSSFEKTRHHLPLTQGKFQLEKLMQFLKKNHYTGELTLEVNDSIFKRILFPYDFSSIKESIEYFRKIADKLS